MGGWVALWRRGVLSLCVWETWGCGGGHDFHFSAHRAVCHLSHCSDPQDKLFDIARGRNTQERCQTHVEPILTKAATLGFRSRAEIGRNTLLQLLQGFEKRLWQKRCLLSHQRVALG